MPFTPFNSCPDIRSNASSEIPEQSKSAMTLMQEGDALFDEEDFSRAYGKYMRAAEVASPIAEVAWLRASIRFHIGRVQERLGLEKQAIESYNQALEEQPSNEFYAQYRDRVLETLKVS